jgi:uncharacterized membrane protein YozB (DUF420 family)
MKTIITLLCFFPLLLGAQNFQYFVQYNHDSIGSYLGGEADKVALTVRAFDLTNFSTEQNISIVRAKGESVSFSTEVDYPESDYFTTYRKRITKRGAVVDVNGIPTVVMLENPKVEIISSVLYEFIVLGVFFLILGIIFERNRNQQIGDNSMRLSIVILLLFSGLLCAFSLVLSFQSSQWSKIAWFTALVFVSAFITGVFLAGERKKNLKVRNLYYGIFPFLSLFYGLHIDHIEFLFVSLLYPVGSFVTCLIQRVYLFTTNLRLVT